MKKYLISILIFIIAFAVPFTVYADDYCLICAVYCDECDEWHYVECTCDEDDNNGGEELSEHEDQDHAELLVQNHEHDYDHDIIIGHDEYDPGHDYDDNESDSIRDEHEYDLSDENTLTVVSAAINPQTGDGTVIFLLVFMTALAGAAFIIRRKKNCKI